MDGLIKMNYSDRVIRSNKLKNNVNFWKYRSFCRYKIRKQIYFCDIVRDISFDKKNYLKSD